MKTKTAKLVIFILATSMVLMISAIIKGYGASSPVVWTDKSNYYPGETVSIFGSEFNPNGYFAIPVIRPDGTIVHGDGSFTPGWDTVQADSYGRLIYCYKLDGVAGLYEVRVYDSPWAGSLDQTPLATTNFTDAQPAANLDQVRNGAFDSPTSPADWVNGNVGSQTGHYVEGYSIPYRATMTDLPIGVTIRITLEYDIKHSGKNAIDYLTYYDRIDNPSHQLVFGHPAEIIDPLIGVTGVTGPNTTYTIPAPSSAGSPVPGQPTASYNNLVGNETIASVQMHLFGGTITNIVYNVQGDLTAADSSTSINVTFTTGSATEVLAWGGHIASREDWGFTNGVPNSAGGISGSPYHMRLLDWTLIPPPAKSSDNLPNLGNQDRSLSAVAVFAPPVPFIALTKTPSVTKAETTTLVTYTYNVTNTGGVDFTDMNITDDQFGVITSGQTLLINQSKIYTFTTTLSQTTTNIATAFGTTGTGATANATATATVTVIHPAISLTKTPSATKVENGASVTYTYNVTNTGDTSLTVSLVDDTFGTIFTGKVLAPGAFNVTSITRTLTTTTTNTATATGVDQLATSVTAQASATVTVLHPSISLTKEASSTKVETGSLVTYTYNVTNTGDTSLTVSLVDDVFGTIFTGKVLPVGAFNVTVITQTLTTTTTNTATATGVDQLSTSVQAQATATVTVLHPAISLTKTPSSTKVENGASVTYTYNVTNTGDTSLTVSLVDDTFGTIFTGKVLAPGEFNVTVITETLTTTTTNTATATGVDQLSTSVTAQASATVTVLHPNISLTKTPSATKVENGALVTYTYNVTNTGDTSLTVSLVDDTFGSIFTGKVLAPGAFNVTVITETLTTTTTNTATATGVDQLSTSVTAEASATVTVLHPAISLTKTPSLTKVENGASVTYTYNVTNTGDTSLTVSLVDDTFGTIFTGKVLAAGAFNVTSITTTLTTTTTNTATATGVDQLSTSVQAQASASVKVITPSIALTKTPSSGKVLNGSSVTYTYNVTNTGDTTLTGNVTDDLLGFIGTFTLAPGASTTFTATTTLTTSTTNTATATGIDQLGTPVSATASGSVVVIHPSISVNKTCSPEDQLAPGTITWTINVTNTGDVTLTAVNITDTRHGVLDAGVTLIPGQVNTYVIVETGLPPGTYYDNATAFGAHQLGRVSDWDDATCTVRPVAILKQFTSVTVLPEGISEGFSAILVDPTHVNVTGLHSGPKIYFTVTYYFENSLNFLGSDFDGQAHNFTLWDKWGGNLMALGSPPIAFNQKTNVVTLADGSTFKIDPTLTGAGTYRGYIGSGLNISNLASQGQAWITMHLGDQQNATNPGNGKGTNKDSNSYDTDVVWYIGQVGVNQSVTLTLYIAPGKNPGGKLLFSSPGCYVINTGPRVRAYGNTYNNADFLYAIERTNTLTVCVKPFDSSSSTATRLAFNASKYQQFEAFGALFLGALFPVSNTAYKKSRRFRCLSRNHA